MDFPAEGTRVQLNSQLIGNWLQDGGKLAITKLDNYTFGFTYESELSPTTEGKGYQIEINKRNFLVIAIMVDGEKKYMTYLLERLNEKQLQVNALDKQMLESKGYVDGFKNAKALSDFLVNATFEKDGIVTFNR